MALERGFRRLVIALSVVVLGLGITLEATILEPHAAVQVTLEDGRKVILDRHGPKNYLSDRDSLSRELVDRGELRPLGPPLAGTYAGGTRLMSVTTVEIIRGPEYWWWTDSVGTKVATGLAALLWIVFYTVRWIAHGFVRQ